MVTINQIKDDFVIDTSDSYVMPIGDLKDFWPGYSREERKVYRTARKEHITINATINAQKVLEDIVESATEHRVRRLRRRGRPGVPVLLCEADQRGPDHMRELS